MCPSRFVIWDNFVDMRLKCACGWEARGTAEEVVEQTQKHALELHNMQAKREDILARMEPVRV